MKPFCFGFALAVFVGCISVTNAWCQPLATSADANAHANRALLPTTAVLIEVDSSRIRIPDELKHSQYSGIANRLVELIKAAAGSSSFYATVDIPSSSMQPIVRLLVPASSPGDVTAAKTELAKLSDQEPIAEDGFVIASMTYGVEVTASSIDESVLPIDRERFASAAQKVARFPVRFGFVPPAHVWETYDELLSELPSALGGGPVSLVTQGIEWAAIGVDVQHANMAITIQSRDPAAAEALAKRLPVMLKSIRSKLQNGEHESLAALLGTFADVARIESSNDQIQITIGKNKDASLSRLLDAVLAGTTGQLASGRNKNRMRQIVLGILNYESAYACFPPAAKFRGADGTCGLSWRVHILPFLNEHELYRQFRLDEPWDSVHNKTLIKRMPDVFKTLSKSGLLAPIGKPGHTTFLAPAGEGTILGGKEVTKLRHVEDGTSKTVILVEVASEKAVPWTAPQDYDFPLNDPSAGLAWDGNGQVGVGLGDGAWIRIPKSTSPEMLRRLFLMNDAQPVDLR